MNNTTDRKRDIKEYREALRILARVISDQFIDMYEKYDDEDIVELIENHFNVKSSEELHRLGLIEKTLSNSKMEVLFHLMDRRKRFDDESADKILAFIDKYDYGWKADRYYSSNHCLRGHSGCRETSYIKSDCLQDVFADVWNIFRHAEYGRITLFLFNYCLSSLFNTLLGHERLRMPFYLQIACEKNSGLYRLIQEILIICDVNSGLIEHCDNSFRDYGNCDYQCVHYYPTQFIEQDLHRLAYNRDIPLIIDGHENGKYYNTLLREIVNIPVRRQPLEMRDRFNLYPIFICPTIESTFDNVISMNLTELTVSKDYLNLIKKNKQMLASWVLWLVRNVSDTFFPTEKDDPQTKAAKNKDHRFAITANASVNHVKKEYHGITPKDATNVGMLIFFFKAYMNAFKKMIYTSNEDAYVCNAKGEKIEVYKTIDRLVNLSEMSLVALHKAVSPVSLELLLVNTMDSASKKPDQRNVEAVKIAKKILKYYEKYRVAFRITKIEVKEDRFIYDILLTPGTEYEHIFRRAGNIQILLDYEHFIPIKDGTSIKIMVSDKLNQTDSLSKLLTSQEFNDGKMKIPYALGHDEKGDARIVDIAEFPHLLMAGVTGSGKSSALECLLTSIAYKHRSGEVYIMAMDLGKSSMYLFDKLDILLLPIIKETDEGLDAILKLKADMEYRYALLHTNRNALGKLPSIVCIIDEFHHLITDIDDKEDKDALENALSGLIKRGRSTKIHMIFATQEPRKEYIKFGGVSNTASRIALLCSDRYESMAAIGKTGAESLVGKGAMIVKLPNNGMMYRNIQGAYMLESEIKRLLSDIKFDITNKYSLEGKIAREIPSQPQADCAEVIKDQAAPIDIYDELLAKAIIWVLSQETAANSDIKNFGVGYDKAKEIMEKLEQFDLITKQDMRKPRNPRQVKHKSLDELLQMLELMEVLTRNNYSKVDLAEALDKKEANSLLPQEDENLQ